MSCYRFIPLLTQTDKPNRFESLTIGLNLPSSLGLCSPATTILIDVFLLQLFTFEFLIFKIKKKEFSKAAFLDKADKKIETSLMLSLTKKNLLRML